jgi:hypothetical protein
VLAVVQIEALPGLRAARIHHDALGIDQRGVLDEIAHIERVRRDVANIEMLRIEQIARPQQQQRLVDFADRADDAFLERARQVLAVLARQGEEILRAGMLAPEQAGPDHGDHG